MRMSTAIAGATFALAVGASTGISTQQARTAAPSAVDGSTATAEGSSLAFARADHQHGPSKTLLPDATATRDLGSASAAWRTLYAPLIRPTTSAATATSLVPALAIEPTATLDANDMVVGIKGTSGGAVVWSVDQEGDVVEGNISANRIVATGASSTLTAADIDSWNVSGGQISGTNSGIILDDNNGNISNVQGLTTVALTTSGGANVASLQVGNGTVIGKHLSATQSLDYDLSGAGITCQDLTITVTGAADGDTVVVGIPNALASTAGIQFSAPWVSAGNTVKLRACDVTSSNPNPAAATVRADVWQH